MRWFSGLALALLLGGWIGQSLTSHSAAPPEAKSPSGSSPILEFPGKTQPAPGKAALICPVPLHPVEEVLVKAGDRVKKDQVLIKLDADEPQADVRNKEAILESARVSHKQARELVDRLRPIKENGAIADQRWHEAQTSLEKWQADERAAKAAWEAAKAELEHYTLTAPMDGVIAWLTVVPGQVSRPGTTVWGQILDLSEIDVRCDLPPAQVDRLALGQNAEVILNGNGDVKLVGKVVTIGIAAEPKTGLVPVLVRLDNKAGKLRCYVDVKVRLQ
jgi:cobalt-zinc-cadmium efflux system membrane fusion protein